MDQEDAGGAWRVDWARIVGGGDLLVLGSGFFFLDELLDQPRDRAATRAARRLRLRSVRVAHIFKVEWFLSADVIVVIKSELAAFAALKILRHEPGTSDRVSQSFIQRLASNCHFLRRRTATGGW